LSFCLDVTVSDMDSALLQRRDPNYIDWSI